MLYAYKRDASTSLAKQLVNLRQPELDYYTGNILAIATQSALLAGFAWSIISSYSSASVLDSLYQFSASVDQSVSFTRVSVEWLRSDMAGGREISLLVVELVYLVATVAAMGNTLYALYVSLLSTIEGNGLALRGPEGSVDRAVAGLADVNREVIITFRSSLLMFYLVLIANGFLNFELIAALVCFVLQVGFVFLIYRSSEAVFRSAQLPVAALQTGHLAADLSEAAAARANAERVRAAAAAGADPTAAAASRAPAGPAAAAAARSAPASPFSQRARAAGNEMRQRGARSATAFRTRGSALMRTVRDGVGELSGASDSQMRDEATSHRRTELNLRELPALRRVAGGEAKLAVLADATHERHPDRHARSFWPSAVSERMLAFWQGEEGAEARRLEEAALAADLFVPSASPWVSWLFAAEVAGAIPLPAIIANNPARHPISTRGAPPPPPPRGANRGAAVELPAGNGSAFGDVVTGAQRAGLLPHGARTPPPPPLVRSTSASKVRGWRKPPAQRRNPYATASALALRGGASTCNLGGGALGEATTPQPPSAGAKRDAGYIEARRSSLVPVVQFVEV